MGNICYNYVKFKGNKNEILDLYGRINGVCDIPFKDTFPQLKDFDFEDGPDWAFNCAVDGLQLEGESGSFGWSLETNWQPPMDGIRYISGLYPGLEMRMTYSDENEEFCGRHDFLAGIMTSDYEGNCLYDWDVLNFVADVCNEKITDPATVLDTAVKIFREWDGMPYNPECRDESHDTVLEAYWDQDGQSTMANDVHALSEVIVSAASIIGTRHLPDGDFDTLVECLEMLRYFGDEVGDDAPGIFEIWDALVQDRVISLHLPSASETARHTAVL